MENVHYKPRPIFWEVTKGCKMCCIHCRATASELSSQPDPPANRSPELYKASLSVIPAYPGFERWRPPLSARYA